MIKNAFFSCLQKKKTIGNKFTGKSCEFLNMDEECFEEKIDIEDLVLPSNANCPESNESVSVTIKNEKDDLEEFDQEDFQDSS